jgi:hypothetical protein
VQWLEDQGGIRAASGSSEYKQRNATMKGNAASGAHQKRIERQSAVQNTFHYYADRLFELLDVRRSIIELSAALKLGAT